MIIPGEYTLVSAVPRTETDGRIEAVYRYDAPRGSFSLTVSFPEGTDVKIGSKMRIEVFGAVEQVR